MLLVKHMKSGPARSCFLICHEVVNIIWLVPLALGKLLAHFAASTPNFGRSGGASDMPEQLLAPAAPSWRSRPWSLLPTSFRAVGF